MGTHEGAATRLAALTETTEHPVAIVLGSGWQAAADAFGEPAAVVPMTDLPGFARPSAQGHPGTIRSVQIGGKRARDALEHYASSEDEARSDAATAALGEIEFASRPFELLAVDPAQETLGEFRLADEDLDDEGLDEEEDEDDTYWRDDALDLT